MSAKTFPQELIEHTIDIIHLDDRRLALLPAGAILLIITFYPSSLESQRCGDLDPKR